MKIVWQLEKATVRDVYEALLERRKIAYTTVMTMMKILEQKQYLKKTHGGPRPRLLSHAAQEPGDPRHGAGIRRPRVQRFRPAPAAPFGRGPVSNRKGAARTAAQHSEQAGEEVMTLTLQNLAIYCLQVAILVAIGGLLPFACRLESVRARLPGGRCCWPPAWLLPLVQPWKQIVIYHLDDARSRGRSGRSAPSRIPPPRFHGRKLCWRYSAWESPHGCSGWRSASIACAPTWTARRFTPARWCAAWRSMPTWACRTTSPVR